MASEEITNPPIWYWIASGLILVWNLFGVFVFVFMVLMVSGAVDIANEAVLAEMTEAEQAQTLITKDVVLQTPMWVNVAFAVAVGFGVLGSLALLMRRKIAVPFFVISLIGVLAQNTYSYFLSDAIEKMGPGLSPAVISIAILLVPFARFCGKRGWVC